MATKKTQQHRRLGQTRRWDATAAQLQLELQGLNVGDMNLEELRKLLIVLANAAGVIDADHNVV